MMKKKIIRLLKEIIVIGAIFEIIYNDAPFTYWNIALD